MSYTFGDEPSDVVANSRGDVLAGVVLGLYPSKVDALASTNVLTSVTSDSSGRWTYTHATLCPVWVRTPSGSVYVANDPTAISPTATAADASALIAAEHTTERAYQSSTFAPGVSVMAYGAVRDGATLDTAAINAAITANPGRRIYLPNGALGVSTYLIDGAVSILLNQQGTKLILDPGVTIKVKTNALDRYAAVSITATDCSVEGGSILGDVGTHTGTTGEFGYGVQVRAGGHRATVNGTRITKCWGDGIIVGENADSGVNQPADCLFLNVIADDNRRQGLSIISALRPKIIGGSYINTGLTAYTSPGSGIDLEPATSAQTVIDATVIGAVLQGNHGAGLNGGSSVGAVSGTVAGVRALNNGGDGFHLSWDVALAFSGCASNNNTGVGYHGESMTSPNNTTFNGCTQNGNVGGGFVGTQHTYTPTVTGFTVGNGSMVATYQRDGDLLDLNIEIHFGSTSTFTGAFGISLPAGITASGAQVCPCTCMQNSTGNTTVTGAQIANADSVFGIAISGFWQGVGPTNLFTWTTNDRIIITGRVRVA